MQSMNYLTLLLCLFAGTLSAQPIVDQYAPRVELSGYSSSRATEAEDAGKYLLVEFWATWCVPCIQELPHLEDIARSYGDRLQVLSLTEQTDATVNEWLATQSVTFPGNIGHDYYGQTLFRYDVTSLPATFLIAPDGDLVWKGRPDQLTDAKLDALLAAPSGTSRSRIRVNTGTTPGPFGIQLSKAAGRRPRNVEWERSYHLVDSLTNVITRLSGVPPAYIEFEGDYPETVVGLSAFGDELDTDKAKAQALSILQQEYDFTIGQGGAKRGRWVLTVAEPGKLWPKTRFGGQHAARINYTDSGEFEADNHPLKTVVKYLEDYTKTPIDNQTGLIKAQDWRVPHGTLDEIAPILLDRYGLLLERQGSTGPAATPVGQAKEMTVVRFN